jgi:hypothetical protein
MRLTHLRPRLAPPARRRHDRLRYWLIEMPARIVDAAFGYVVLLTAAILMAFTTVALWAILWLAGYPLP